MAVNDLIQRLVALPGQQQNERLPRELDIHFADVDERTTRDLLLFAQRLARHIAFYGSDDQTPSGDWRNFFPFDAGTVDQLAAREDGGVAPHLALFLAFLELYRKPRELINRLTGRHLEFYYRDVLHLSGKPPVADRVHVLLELKKQARPVQIHPGHLFSAGKDPAGIELLYRPLEKTIVNAARVVSIRSLYLDETGDGILRCAPVADSADGLGTPVTDAEGKWRAFGHALLPAAEVGFALVSPVLRMAEGKRTVTVTLGIDGLAAAGLSDSRLRGGFHLYLTGEKNWLGPYPVSPTIKSGNTLEISLTLPAEEKPVADYDAAVHGYHYTCDGAALQVLLNRESPPVYADLAGLTLRTARITVAVAGIRSLTLEGDSGGLNARKPFQPFGPQPGKGARLMIGCREALAKKLSELKLHLHWRDTPGDQFAGHYADYGSGVSGNGWFTADVAFHDSGGWQLSRHGEKLFEDGNAAAPHTMSFSTTAPPATVPPAASPAMQVRSFANAGSHWAAIRARQLVMVQPLLQGLAHPAAEPRQNFITLSLNRDFLHAAYRNKYVEAVMDYSQGKTTSLTLPNEPYTPVLQSLTLDYTAHSDTVDVSDASLNGFAGGDLCFFHVDAFGQMREHAYQRRQLRMSDSRVPLFPAHADGGALLLGFSELTGGDSVSVLFQVAEGSADPEFAGASVVWSVLCDNYWKTLPSGSVIGDTTNNLLTSGVITFVIPTEATTTNTLLPAGALWLKATVTTPAAVCQLVAVAANAVTLRREEDNRITGHLASTLPPGRISAMKKGLAGLRKISQPYASFGGSGPESDDHFHRRVAERLRHKNRCISSWDYERIVLEAFPKIHKVKCIPHASADSWLAPGHVMLVVVPDLRNHNAVDPLQPRVDADTITRITELVRDRCGTGVRLLVRNPSYQKVRLDFKVIFRKGYEFNYHKATLAGEIKRYLSPWAYDGGRDIAFGGGICKSVLLDFVEHRDYVDFVTDFRMYSYGGDTCTFADSNEARAERPDAILVSAETHDIGRAGA
ncbi:MAG: baseplate J/gp47 family protein [Thermodesulfobacteriota bacterium]